ncbi:lanthionine synthetase LanC family protein [Chryseobacterium sp. JK1]|uniref:lanthionine synthetase LanC family protein n=1 Tax=Chryseobacterium sp. JK1 TaxID=874294 RepID=UPI003D69C177
MKQNQEEYYLNIVKLLKIQSFSYPSLGLNGRCAAAIFLFELSGKENNTEIYDQAIDFIERELNEIDKIENLSLYNGLCGIAWTIQYLANEDFIDLNVDSYLSQYLEKHFIQFKDNNYNISTVYQFQTYTDLLFYFSSRYISVKKERQKIKYAQLISQILIILNQQSYTDQTFERQNSFPFQNIFFLLRALIYLLDIDFQSPLIKPLLQKIKEKIEKKKDFESGDSYQMYILRKVTIYTSKSQSFTDRKPVIKDYTQNNHITTKDNSIGIWNNSIVHDAIRKILTTKPEKDLGLNYILECQYNSY